MTTRIIQLSLLVTLLIVLSPAAFASPLPGGSLTPIVFDDGGTVTGSFSLDATGTTLTGCSFTSSGGTSGLPGFTYDCATSTAIWAHFGHSAGTTGPMVAYLNIYSPNFTARPRHNLFLAFFDTGLNVGANLGLCDIDGGACLTDGPLSLLVQSGEQFLDASNNQILRDVKHGSFDITDPPAALSFGSNSLQSGGGPTPTPEPASVLLLGVGIVGLGLTARNRFGA